MRTKTNANAPMPDAEKQLDELLKTAKGQAQLQPLMRLIAQALDEAVAGGDCNIRIGTNKARSTLMVTVYLNGEAMYATANDLVALLEAAETLL